MVYYRNKEKGGVYYEKAFIEKVLYQGTVCTGKYVYRASTPDYLDKVRIFRYDRDLYVRGVYNGTVVKEVCVWDY